MTDKIEVPVQSSTHAQTIEDLSGIPTTSFDNPYDALLTACDNDPTIISERYALHRETRNAQQKLKMLDPSFQGVTIDPILLRLADPTVEPGYTDTRNCLVFWARPTQAVKSLVLKLQNELKVLVPNMWLMPQSNLHLTAMEITHSKSLLEINDLVSKMYDSIQDICNYTYTHPTRLGKPQISFDSYALALSFIPTVVPTSPNRTESYTYHHLRRDLYALCSATGVSVDSRYVVPSSHLTIGRYIKTTDFEDQYGVYSPEKMRAFIDRIEELNEWLANVLWPKANEGVNAGVEWLVGHEKGLECRKATLWYGGGEQIYLGKGF